jgi:leucine dehydrogenase
MTKIYDDAIKSNPTYIESITNRPEIPDNESVKMSVVEATGLAKDMLYKWAIQRAMLKYTRDHHPEVFPPQLERRTIDAWIEASKFGGGKSVMVDERPRGSEEIEGTERQSLFLQHARHINSLNNEKGKGNHHKTAPDMRVHKRDVRTMSFVTKDVACLPEEFGGSGDPSPVTALGVYHGINSMLEFMKKDGNKTTFAIQGGAGEVSKSLIKHLRTKYKDADIVISDIQNPEKLAEIEQLKAEFNVRVVEGDEIFDQGGIFVPSGPPAQLNEKHLRQMKGENLGKKEVVGVIGPANSLYPPGDEDRMAKKFHEEGILIAPAPLVNLGGIFSLSSEYVEEYGGQKPTKELINGAVAGVGPLLKFVFERAHAEQKLPGEIFEEIALDEIADLFVEKGILQKDPNKYHDVFRPHGH